MPFSEKSDFKDERRPLLRDPVWHYNHRYGRGRGYDEEEMEELFGRANAKNQRFQWMLFLGVTLLSVLILLGALAVLINLSETHPSVGPKVPSSTTVPPPFSKLPSTTSNPGLPVTTSTSTTPSTTSSPSDINVFVSPQENT